MRRSGQGMGHDALPGEDRVDREQHHRVCQLLFHEARLADEHRYEEWLELWVDEGASYLVPMDLTPDDQDLQSHIIRDDRARLEERVFRMAHTQVHAQDPPSELSRVVSNVQVYGQEGGTLIARSSFMLMEVRRDAIELHGGHCRHELLPAQTALGFKIQSKTVVLTRRMSPVKNLTFIL